MSWKIFQQDAFNLSDRDVKRLTKEVISQYRLAIKSLSLLLSKAYLNLSDADPDNYYKEMIKRNRLESLLSQVRSEYNKYSLSANSYVRAAIGVSFSNTYYYKQYAANWLTKKEVFFRLPKSIIELTVSGTNEAWKNVSKAIEAKIGNKSLYVPQTGTLSNLLKNNRTKEIARIRTAIVQSFVNGRSYNQAVNEIRSAIGKEKKVGNTIKYTGSKANALRIIRTETNRTQNLGSYADIKVLDDAGVDVEREYIAVLDNRTRAQSASMDGQRVKVDQPFRYPNKTTAMTPGTSGVAKYDINDRCGQMDIVEGNSPEIRRGRNPVTGKNEVFSYRSFNDWASEHDLKRNIYGEII